MNWLREGLVCSLVEQAESALYDLALLPEYPKDRKGGYLTLCDGASGEVLLLVPVGEIPLKKQDHYRRLSQEKASRLCWRPHHVSSWQSKDELQEKYAGAIRVPNPNLIMSFSGLPEIADEALCLILAQTQTGWIFDEEAKTIARLSGNEWYQKYVENSY